MPIVYIPLVTSLLQTQGAGKFEIFIASATGQETMFVPRNIERHGDPTWNQVVPNSGGFYSGNPDMYWQRQHPLPPQYQHQQQTHQLHTNSSSSTTNNNPISHLPQIQPKKRRRPPNLRLLIPNNKENYIPPEFRQPKTTRYRNSTRFFNENLSKQAGSFESKY